MSVGKPTSSTIVSLTGLFKEKDERIPSSNEAPNKSETDEKRDAVNVTETEFLGSRVKVLYYELIDQHS